MAIYKDKLRGTWLFRVYIEDKYGNKKQKCRSGFKTKTEAKKEELKFISISKQDFTDMTFQELYNIYIKSKEQVLKANSLRSMKSRFENHIIPYFKDYNIYKINNKVLLDWKEYILNKNFSDKYNSNLYIALVGILNYGMIFYDLKENIASKVGSFTKKELIKKITFWTYKEFLSFILKVEDIEYRVLYTTLYFTGIRIGECLALTWNDLINDYLDINKTLSRVRQTNGEYSITTPKTLLSIRKIKLDHMTLKLLLQLKEYYQNFISFNENWFIFGGLKAMSQTTIGRKKDVYCKMANVKRIKIHDFRHSHATLLLSKGVPITVISKRLGHSDINMTLNTYSHLIPEDEEKAINIINDLNKENFK